MTPFHGATGNDPSGSVSEHGDEPEIQAGKAFMAATESDSEAKQSLANAATPTSASETGAVVRFAGIPFIELQRFPLPTLMISTTPFGKTIHSER